MNDLSAVTAAPSAPEPAPKPSALKPIPLPQPSRRINLQPINAPDLQSAQTVESLLVQELRGPGATFTPNLDLAMTFNGLVHRPPDEFEKEYQIVTGPLQNDPRVSSRMKQIVFVPGFSWQTLSMILVPFKASRYGRRVLADLERLTPRFPSFKAFVEWSETRRCHLVRYLPLTASETEFIAKVKWPTREEILDALQASAFDNIDDLAEANDEIRTILQSKEVQ